jgi:glucokinase
MIVIAIDLGGTKVAAMLVDSQGRVLSKTSALLGGRTGKEVGALVREQIVTLSSFAKKKRRAIAGIGLCVPGIARRKTKTVWAPNISGWSNYPLEKEVRMATKRVPVRIESDRTCYILGEQWRGAARGCTDAIFLAVGTGIGAGIMVDGHIIHGSNDIAGAIGWMALKPPWQNKFKSCGCFEFHASGVGIAHKVAHITPRVSLTTREIFAAYRKGDPVAKNVVDEAILFWGMAVANLVSLFNPQKIIFGGGVFGPAEIFLNRIYIEAKKWAQPVSIRDVRLVKSQLSGNAGLYGAAWLALNPNEHT